MVKRGKWLGVRSHPNNFSRHYQKGKRPGSSRTAWATQWESCLRVKEGLQLDWSLVQLSFLCREHQRLTHLSGERSALFPTSTTGSLWWSSSYYWITIRAPSHSLRTPTTPTTAKLDDSPNKSGMTYVQSLRNSHFCLLPHPHAHTLLPRATYRVLPWPSCSFWYRLLMIWKLQT